MRRGRLIVSLLTAAASQVARASQVVSFDDDFSQGAVFTQLANNDSQAKQFVFRSSQAISIQYISLYEITNQSPPTGLLIAQWSPPHGAVSTGSDGGNGVNGDNSTTAGTTNTPAADPAGTVQATPSPVLSMKRFVPPFVPQQSTPVGISSQSTPVSLSTQFTAPGTAGTVSIQNLYANQSYLDQPLYFVVSWSILDTNEVGTSSSREFAFTADSSQEACINGDGRAEPTFCSLETIMSAFPNPVFPDTTSTAASTPGLTAVTSEAAAGNPLTGPSASTASNHLSTGAIVGIAVGCGFAGLLILCIVACILLRRHKRRQNLRESSPVPFGSRSRTEELIAEKEANAGVTETPHSPYSDDGMPGDSAGVAAAARRERSHPNGVINTNVERSYTPYSDNRSSAPQLSPAVAAASSSQHNAEEQRHSVARSATSQGVVSGRYAHLVEEGMTEDDIRRLEEEERQLDAAIERAGRTH